MSKTLVIKNFKGQDPRIHCFTDTEEGEGVAIYTWIDSKKHRLIFETWPIKSFGQRWTHFAKRGKKYEIQLEKADYIGRHYDGCPGEYSTNMTDEFLSFWWGKKEGIRVKCVKDKGNYTLYIKRIFWDQKSVFRLTGIRALQFCTDKEWDYRLELTEENIIKEAKTREEIKSEITKQVIEANNGKEPVVHINAVH